MTALIVDASVAVKWLVQEEQTTIATAIAQSVRPLIAPRILFTEVANAMVRKVIRGDALIDKAVKHCQKLPMFFDEIVEIDDVIPLAMRNAERFRHPVYDLIYLELAYRRDIRFVTADRRLANKLVDTPLAKHIVLLSDWRPA